MAESARILVVDDELPVCKSIVSALSDGSNSVDMALSGEEALQREQECHYDVVLTDLMMPGLGGIDLLRQLKKQRADIKVIMITGYPSIKSAVQAIKLGAFDYIPKPFTPNDLRSLVWRALESRQFDMKQGGADEIAADQGAAIEIPEGLLSIPDNSWVKVEGNEYVRMGVHHHFISVIETITAIRFPEVNEMRYQGEVCVRITDSNNFVHRVWAPVSGMIGKLNDAIKKDHSKIINDPYGEGWLLLIKPVHLEDDLKNLVAIIR